MPTLKQATQPRDTSNMTPLTGPAATAPVARPAIPTSADPEFSPLAIAPVPPILGTDTDAARQYYRQGVSQLRMPPLPTAATPAVGAQAASQTKVIIEGGSSSITNNVFSATFQTDGINNSEQDILNLESGLNIFLTAGVAGSVQFNVPIFNASGANHSSGAVPDPGAFAGSTRYLREDGSFQIPPGTGGAANYQTVQSSGTPAPTEPTLNFLGGFVVTDNPGNTSTDISTAAEATYFEALLTGDQLITASTLTTITDTILFVTFPSSGGPWRADVSYTMNWTTGATPTVNIYCTDGTNPIFAGSQLNGASSGINGQSNSARGISRVTYANGATATFQLLVQAQNNITIKQNPAFVGPVSMMQIVVVPCN